MFLTQSTACAITRSLYRTRLLSGLLFLGITSLSPVAGAQPSSGVCGDTDASGTVRCDTDRYGSYGSYSAGSIQYDTRDDDLNVIVDDVTTQFTSPQQAVVWGETLGDGDVQVTVDGATINDAAEMPLVQATSIAGGSATLEVTGNSIIENTGTDSGIAVRGFAPVPSQRNPRLARPGATGNLFLTLTAGSTVTVQSSSSRPDIVSAVLGEHRHIGALTIRSAGNVTNRGTGYGVAGVMYAAGNSAPLDVEVNGGRVNSQRAGLLAEHRGTGNVRAVMSAGAITTSGIGPASSGILGRSLNTDQTVSRRVEVLLSGGRVTTTGTGAFGIYGEHQGLGDLLVSLTGGRVSTVATGVAGLHGGTGTITVTAGAGRVDTTGVDGHGISGEHQGMGAVTIRSASGVTTVGNRANGIRGLISNADNSATIDITVTGGSVETGGDRGYGILGEHQGMGAVTIRSAGEVITRGSLAHSVWGHINNADNSATIDITVTGGSMETTGNRAYGIYGLHRGMGAITIRSAGEITTRGANGAHGVLGFIRNTENSALLDVAITGGSIETTTGTGLFAWHQGMGAITVRSAGEITTRGANGHGMLAYSSNMDNSATVDVAATGGRVETLGDTAYGLYGLHQGLGAVTIRSAADISTRGDNSWGVVGAISNFDNNAAVDVAITGGRVATLGDNAIGLYGLHQGLGAVTIRSAADISTRGQGAHGVAGLISNTENSAALNIAITGGSVDARGDMAHGVIAEHPGMGLVLVTINGAVNGGTGTGRGVRLVNGGTVIVGPGGVLRARSGIALQAAAGSLRLNVQEGGQIGRRDERDVQRIQGSEADGDTTTVEAYGIVLLRDNELTGETANAIYGVMDRSLQLMAESEAADSLDCGARCWRWLLGEPVLTARAFALEVLPQTLLNLTRPAREWQRGDYEGAETGPWLRVSGHHGSYEAASASAHNDYKQQWVRTELGIQGILPWWTRDGCKTLAGISGHFLDSSADDIQSVGTGQGNLDTTGSGFGLHLRWQDVYGYYVRVEGTGTWYDGQLATTRMRSDHEGFGWAMSLAGGRSLPWAGRPGVTLIPQAQLSWAEIQVDGINMPFAVSVDQARSVRGRLGLRMEKAGQWKEAATLLYGAGSVEYEFDGETVVTTGGPDSTRLATRPERTWWALSMGASLTGQGGGPLARLGVKEYELTAQAQGAMGAPGNYEASISANLHLRF